MPSSNSTEQIAAGRHRIAELEKRIGELEEAVASRDSFIAVVAHELRNPMTPILGNVQRLRRIADRPPPRSVDLRAGLERLEWLIERYLKRATTLLDVSRISAGKHQFSPEPLDFAQIVRAVIESVKPVARYVRSAIAVEAPDELVGMCDRMAFEQIVENLVTNSLKYGAGHPVAVGLRRQASRLELRVADQGPGISAADQARIFERFERVIARAQKAGGFGIGLWVVRQLVEAMSGMVEVKSELGRGSTFIVTLPIDATGDKCHPKEPAP